jgi:hypothetical protein
MTGYTVRDAKDFLGRTKPNDATDQEKLASAIISHPNPKHPWAAAQRGGVTIEDFPWEIRLAMGVAIQTPKRVQEILKNTAGSPRCEWIRHLHALAFDLTEEQAEQLGAIVHKQRANGHGNGTDEGPPDPYAEPPGSTGEHDAGPGAGAAGTHADGSADPNRAWDEHAREPGRDGTATGQWPELTPWWVRSKDIPPRAFLYDKHYCRRSISATIAAGGRAKTTLSCYEAVAMAAGFDPDTRKALAAGPLRVLLLNAEEDQDELDRRIAAICDRYAITQAELGGRLIAKSVRRYRIKVATLKGDVPEINKQAVDYITREIEKHRADVFMLDPLVSFHQVRENDNSHMDFVVKDCLGPIADMTNAAGEIFHHVGKPKPGQAESSVEDSRGASAVIWAVRSARVLNFMTAEQANKFGIAPSERYLHIKVENGKANMGAVGQIKWIKLGIENLPNGDGVAFASPWTPPNHFEGVTTKDMELAVKLAATGEYRSDSRSPQWFGYALAKQMNIPVSYRADNSPLHLAKIKALIKTWLGNEVLATETREDDKRRDREFIIPGPKANDHAYDPQNDPM